MTYYDDEILQIIPISGIWYAWFENEDGTENGFPLIGWAVVKRIPTWKVNNVIEQDEPFKVIEGLFVDGVDIMLCRDRKGFIRYEGPE